MVQWSGRRKYLTVLAFIGKPGESVDSGQSVVVSEKAAPAKPQSITTEAQPSTTNYQSSTANRDIGFISPVVAKIAAEHGVNLQQVQGTGLNGRITKNDVLNYVESQKSKVCVTIDLDP